jgi:hypothetical protein
VSLHRGVRLQRASCERGAAFGSRLRSERLCVGEGDLSDPSASTSGCLCRAPSGPSAHHALAPNTASGTPGPAAKPNRRWRRSSWRARDGSGLPGCCSSSGPQWADRAGPSDPAVLSGPGRVEEPMGSRSTPRTRPVRHGGINRLPRGGAGVHPGSRHDRALCRHQRLPRRAARGRPSGPGAAAGLVCRAAAVATRSEPGHSEHVEGLSQKPREELVASGWAARQAGPTTHGRATL